MAKKSSRKKISYDNISRDDILKMDFDTFSIFIRDADDDKLIKEGKIKLAEYQGKLKRGKTK